MNLFDSRWRSQNAEKVIHIKGETTGSSSDSLQLLPFSKKREQSLSLSSVEDSSPAGNVSIGMYLKILHIYDK